MKIFITGGTGFVGSSLTREFSKTDGLGLFEERP